MPDNMDRDLDTLDFLDCLGRATRSTWTDLDYLDCFGRATRC